MKKVFLTMFFVFLLGFTAYAAEPEPADLKFTPAGGGKYIYCNNEEGIFLSTLADSTTDEPSYIMNNYDLTPDKYIIYLSHFNYTHTSDNSYNALERGFDVELDVEIYATEDTEIVINRTAFEFPANIYTENNGNISRSYAEYGSINACADLMNETIYRLHSDTVYRPRQQEPQTVNIRAGQRIWLSQYIDNYAAVPYLKPVHLAADIDIVSGRADINVAAFKATDKLGDRSGFRTDSAFGTYKRDKMQKGIADTLPEVNAYLEYEIDDSMPDGTALPVRVYNQYCPDGNVTETWVTNINPQDDQWAKLTAAESDMLTYRYYDPEKRLYYGKNVPEEEKDDVWVFDVFHSETKDYVGYAATGVGADDYKPNYLLDIDRDNIGYACCMGNYGVTNRYHLIVTNNGSQTRYFDYKLFTGASVIVKVTDENGNLLQPTLTKGQTIEQTEDIMTSIELPAGESRSFIIETTLPVNYNGGLKNTFLLGSDETELDYSEEIYYRLPEMSADTETSSIYRKVQNNAAASNYFDGNFNNYEFVKTLNGYMTRWKAWDGKPSMQTMFWGLVNDVAFFDDNMNIIGSQQSSKFPADTSYAGGKFYIQYTDGSIISSTDGARWSDVSSGVMPLGGAETKFAAASKDGVIYAGLDGDDMLPVELQTVSVPYMEYLSGVFIASYDNYVYVSYDGVYWTILQAEAQDEIESIDKRGGYLIINDEERVALPRQEGETSYVILNGEYLGFDQAPLVSNDRLLVPMRFIFEQLDMEVDWDEETLTATATRDGFEIAFTIGSNIARVNGVEIEMDVSPEQVNWRTLIPLRFLSENLGYTVNWDEANRTAEIIG